MKYLSLFSGIESASVAWQPLGWDAVGFAEIDPFCCKVLATRFTEVKNYGDVRNITKDTITEHFDLIVGGSPCQNFSVAGTREGLGGIHSCLATEFIRIAGEYKARWLLWENVPGAITSRGGRFCLYLSRT